MDGRLRDKFRVNSDSFTIRTLLHKWPGPKSYSMDVEIASLPLLVGLAAGFFLGWIFLKAQIASTEQRYKADLERWKAEFAAEIRKDSVNRSRSTLKGKIAEQMAPLLPSFCYHPADARFIGSPVDYIVFDGLSLVGDEKESPIRIVFMDVKQGTAALSRTQRLIKKAVEEKAVSWRTLHIEGE